MDIYDFYVKSNTGETIEMRQYQGKVLLIVNTAIKCGFTKQYTALETLYQKFQSQGFEVLDFPCNQFMNQAPGSDESIDEFCTLNYQTSFTRFSKVKVNGKEADPLFVWLKQQKPVDKTQEKPKATDKLLQALHSQGDIAWNFCKFLIDRNGNVVERYAPSYDPEAIEKDIQSII